MTVNFEFVNKLRDVLVAEQVGKKAALGYFEVEFTVYGCAYYLAAEDMMYYKMSSRAEDIYAYVEKAQGDDIFPGKVESMTLKCQVPLGEKETIELKVKQKLAKKLQEQYPKKFFLRLQEIAQRVQNNSAAPILWDIAAEIEGYFAEYQLEQFAEIVRYAYSCRRLDRAEYARLRQWLGEEDANMTDEMVSKNICEKTLYGIAYQDGGQIKYIANAQYDYILKKTEELERGGKTVTPVWKKQYFYDYQTRLSETVKLFKENLCSRYSSKYMKELGSLRASGFTQAEIIALGREACANEACAETLKRYAARWSVFAN